MIDISQTVIHGTQNNACLDEYEINKIRLRILRLYDHLV